MNRLLCSAVVAALIAPAAFLVDAAASQPTAPKELMKARHDHFHDLGDAFKVIRDQTRGDNPDMAAIKKAAKHVNDASINQEQWFPAGTGPETGKTQALAAIWQKPAEFKQAMKMFSEAAPKLQAAANSGDAAAVKTAFGDTGKACKNCHDQFRAKEHD